MPDKRGDAEARSSLGLEELLATTSPSVTVSWNERDVVSYAVIAGFARDEYERAELPYLFEGRGLLVLPSFAATLVSNDWLDVTGWRREHALPAARQLEVFSPLRPADEIEIRSQVTAAWPDRAGSGCYIQTRSEAHRTRDNRALFALISTYHARANRLNNARRAPGGVPAPGLPTREPDFSVVQTPAFHDSVLYRWLAAGPAWHVDTDAARRAGFDRPTVPADAVAAMVCRSVLATVCDYDPTLLRGFSVRYNGAAFSDEELGIRMWQDGPVIAFATTTLDAAGRSILDGRCVLTT